MSAGKASWSVAACCRFGFVAGKSRNCGWLDLKGRRSAKDRSGFVSSLLAPAMKPKAAASRRTP
jgi:adenylosuccinate synthase